ncbi:MAG TPA: ATP-grasp domain-containing protein [Thermomicrobiaceae bacterium]|nr:ATP-grasp domain-containing protein [Thermomicrobiaceae bacterium]
MANGGGLVVLCMASHEKGQDLLRECKRQGSHVILLTTTEFEHGDWPRDSIDEFYTMPNLYNLENVTNGVSYLMRDRPLARIIPLDDFDVETAAWLRQHLQLPGIGTTIANHFRDKLAMRTSARRGGVDEPDFVGVLNYDQIRDFMARVPPPWFMKPRGEASAVGIHRLETPDQFWAAIEPLGDQQSHYLLEQYVAGQVFHVDSIVWDGEVVFAEVHRYGHPPFDVMHGGGIFTSRPLPRGSATDQALKELNAAAIAALGLPRGVTHLEAIQGQDDGRFYFLECAARVGGANIADGIELATGINLWREWAKIELSQESASYTLPERREEYSGVIITLARQQYPDLSGYTEPEIAWRMNKEHHAGLIVVSPDPSRVNQLLDHYLDRFYQDFHASMRPPDSLRE